MAENTDKQQAWRKLKIFAFVFEVLFIWILIKVQNSTQQTIASNKDFSIESLGFVSSMMLLIMIVVLYLSYSSTNVKSKKFYFLIAIVQDQLILATVYSWVVFSITKQFPSFLSSLGGGSVLTFIISNSLFMLDRFKQDKYNKKIKICEYINNILGNFNKAYYMERLYDEIEKFENDDDKYFDELKKSQEKIKDSVHDTVLLSMPLRGTVCERTRSEIIESEFKKINHNFDLKKNLEMMELYQKQLSDLSSWENKYLLIRLLKNIKKAKTNL